MNKNIKDQLKESFMNSQFIIIFIGTIFIIIFYNILHLEFLFKIATMGVIIFIFYIVGFFNGVKMRNHADEIKNGKLKYDPCIIDKNTFIEECKNGLLYSLVKIDGTIYEIEAQLYKYDITKYDKFVCYVNETKIIGLDNFLNYKFDGIHSFNDLDNIEFLEYFNSDPKKYFIDKIL